MRHSLTLIHAREILDSRGNPTIEVGMHADEFSSSASVPSGKSKGKYEAIEKRDGGVRYGGMGVARAVEHLNGGIAGFLKGFPVGDQPAFDRRLHEIDGTDRFEKIGANTAIGLSIAYSRLSAHSEHKHLYQHLMELTGRAHLSAPRLFMNVINGGAHAGGALAVQEFHAIPRANSIADAIEAGVMLYLELKKLIEERFGKQYIQVGDEGGFAPPVKTTSEAIALIKEAAERCGEKNGFGYGLDAAASSFWDGLSYRIDGKSLDANGLAEHWKALVAEHGLEAIEDPFREDDFAAFANFKALMGTAQVAIIGDDLTVTNTVRIAQAHDTNAVNGVIIKPNQIGTVSDAMDATALARSYGWKIVASHRSGDTEDVFIGDFAVGVGADAVKIGAPCRGERTAKYNRLLKIFE